MKRREIQGFVVARQPCNQCAQQLTMDFLLKGPVQSQGTSLGLATHMLLQCCLLWMPIAGV